MSDPAVLVVSDETDTLKSLVGVLERRFGGDYRILTDRPSPAALARLQAVCEGGEEVVLVIADSLEWLASTRDVCPRGVRCILVRYGEATRLAVMRRAL